MWLCLVVFVAMSAGIFGGGLVAGLGAIWVLYRLIKEGRVTSYKLFYELPVRQL